MKYNLHTHSFYCGHGSGRISEYAEYADKNGYEVLGFSEHCPFPDNRFHSTRMDYSQMGDYLSDIEEEASKRSMIILRGFECDYFPEYRSYFEDVREDVDYLITGTHFMISGDRISNPFDGSMTKEDLFIYADSTIKAMESGLFAFVCHPDVYLSHCPFDNEAEAVAKDIIALSNELLLPLEVNANGIAKSIAAGCKEYGYPNNSFWSLASSMNARCVMNADAHSVESIDKYSDKLEAFVSEHALNMVTPIIESVGGKSRLSFR